MSSLSSPVGGTYDIMSLQWPGKVAVEQQVTSQIKDMVQLMVDEEIGWSMMLVFVVANPCMVAMNSNDGMTGI